MNILFFICCSSIFFNQLHETTHFNQLKDLRGSFSFKNISIKKNSDNFIKTKNNNQPSYDSTFKNILIIIAIFVFLFFRWLQNNFTIKENNIIYLKLYFKEINSQIILSFLISTVLPILILIAINSLVNKIINKNSVEIKCSKIEKEEKIISLDLLLIKKSILYVFLSNFTKVFAMGLFFFSALITYNLDYRYREKFSLLVFSSEKPFNFWGVIVWSVFLSIVAIAFKLVFKPEILKEKKNKYLQMQNVIIIVLLILSIIIIYSTKWMVNNFGYINADQLLFQLKSNQKGTDSDMIKSFVINSLLVSVVVSGILSPNIVKINNTKLVVKTKDMKNKTHKSILYKYFPIILVSIIIFFSLYNFFSTTNFFAYLNDYFSKTNFIEKNYVEPKENKYIFPDEKRNLIHIYMESMENSFFDVDNGGVQKENYMPELSDLAKNNVNFSNTENIGGATSVPGTTWTMAALVANHSGIPLKNPKNKIDYSKNDAEFLPDIYNLGDILENAGYNQTVLVGSDGDYADRDEYFKSHGNYTIKDIFTMKEEGKLPEDYWEFWGFEDEKLYDFAKDEILDLAKKDAPFNFSMLTIDTHTPEGYICRLCDDTYEEDYKNVLACSSKQVDDFIKWMEKQDFYENTTVIISGDHLSMAPFVSKSSNNKVKRTVFNTFINLPEFDFDENRTVNREFYTPDMFPTILTSLNIEYTGDRLALGTDLFSATPTILEENGYKKVRKGFNEKSLFYENLHFQDMPK